MIVAFILILLYIFPLNPLSAAPFSEDFLYLFDSYEDFSAGYYENMYLCEDSEGFLKLSYKSSCFSSAGKYTSKVIKTDFPVEEVYPSWNIVCPKQNAGFKIYIRVSSDSKEWSGWYYMGSWGECPHKEKEFLKDTFGKVEIDSIFLSHKINYIQYTIFMFSDTYGTITPEVKLFSLSCGNRHRSEILSYPLPSDYKSPGILNVPYRSQGDEDRAISGQICSPTSVSMVMEYWNVNIPTSEVAFMCYDKEYDIYGIWPSAVQAATQYGFKGWVRIFSDWSQVEKEILLKRPVIATICFDMGELDGSFTPDSDGHVIVITGFDSNGNPVCKDPAGRNPVEGTVVYNRYQLERAWLWESGIGYVIVKE